MENYHLLSKSPDNSIDSPQAGERSGEDSYDDKEEEFEDIVKYLLPVYSGNHFIGNDLFCSMRSEKLAVSWHSISVPEAGRQPLRAKRPWS